MPELNLTRILRSNLLAQPDSVPATIESLGGDIGASDVVVYLVDFGQQFLEPLPALRQVTHPPEPRQRSREPQGTLGLA